LQSGYRVVVALIVVLMMSLYAHAKGDAMGATFPRRFSLKSLRDRTLSNDVVEFVGSRGEVSVEVVGEVVDMEGYPPMPEATRTAIKTGEWRLPADLPLSELETRFADRLRTELGLADVSVTIDERGRASVVAAPPLSGISKRVPAGKRAVSVDALVPTGMARGEEVVVLAGDESIEGTVIAARSGDRKESTPAIDRGPEADANADAPVASPAPSSAPTTTGGEGRVTVAVSRKEAETLLGIERGRIVVTSRGTRREFELISLLRRAGKRFRKLAVGANSSLAGRSVGEADLRDSHSVAVLAVKRPDGWIVAPRGSTELRAGDELYAVGTREALDGFEGVLT
jgi:K+/H+ antiporter YhaU regulatory subunit KhtT